MDLSRHEIEILKRCISRLFCLRGWVIDSAIPCESFLFYATGANVIHIRRDYFYRSSQLNLVDNELQKLRTKWDKDKTKYDSYVVEVIGAELPGILIDENFELYTKLKGSDIDVYFQHTEKTQVYYTFKLK